MGIKITAALVIGAVYGMSQMAPAVRADLSESHSVTLAATCKVVGDSIAERTVEVGSPPDTLTITPGSTVLEAPGTSVPPGTQVVSYATDGGGNFSLTLTATADPGSSCQYDSTQGGSDSDGPLSQVQAAFDRL